MYRVLLVDDEAIARIGLRTTFDWEKHGFKLLGEASNGQKAMKWIQSGEVDILITDIAMPVMDGLELTRRARELCPRVKVLLLSCHSDFEFVREGIRLGASDYILKPTLDSESLKAVLDQMCSKLEEEKQMQMILSEHELQQRMNKKRAAEKRLFQALSGDTEAMENADIAKFSDGYVIAVIQLDSEMGGGWTVGQSKDWHDEIERFMQLLYDKVPEALAARLETNRLAAWVPIRTEERAQAPACEITMNLPMRCTIGISRKYKSVDKLQEAFKEANETLEAGFFYGDQRIFRAEELPFTSRHSTHEHYASEFHAVRTALAVGNVSKGEGHLKAIMERWEPGSMKKQTVLEEAEELLGLFALHNLTGDLMLPQIGELGRLRSVEEVKGLIQKGYQALQEESLRHPLPESTLHERIVLQAIQYIHAHFTEPISLKEVADKVAVSRNYFSELFKRVTGHNFIDFVIDLRIKRAKELLTTSSLRVYEVADRSGFNDVKYFSKLFKKMVGMTPAEYQGLNRK